MRERPKPKLTLVGAWMEALTAFARLCDRTNAGGATEAEVVAHIAEMDKLAREIRRTKVQ